MLIQNQKLGFRINILELRSIKIRKTRGQLASDEIKMRLDITLILSIMIYNGWGELRIILISYLSTMNTLTSSCIYICNGAVITSFNVCHIFRNWLCHNSRYILKLKNYSLLCVR